MQKEHKSNRVRRKPAIRRIKLISTYIVHYIGVYIVNYIIKLISTYIGDYIVNYIGGKHEIVI